MKIVSIAAAAVMLLTPVAASAQALSGAWKVTLQIAGMTIPIACTIAQSGADLTGSCGGADGKPDALTGKVDGSKVTFAYDTTFNDMPMHVAYAGEMKPDNTLAGTVEVPGASGTFTATK